MEAIVARDNLKKALAQVKRNKGAPGIDGMTVAELTPYLKEHWPAIRAQLLDGTHRPQPVRRVEIPKPAGGTRALGIPSLPRRRPGVLDRFIQQAVLQVPRSQWDATFSPSSYGFRPGRSAHQAVARAQRYIAAGRRWVVDIARWWGRGGAVRLPPIPIAFPAALARRGWPAQGRARRLGSE
jgi:RNA-directed DNA polymerase